MFMSLVTAGFQDLIPLVSWFDGSDVWRCVAEARDWQVVVPARRLRHPTVASVRAETGPGAIVVAFVVT